MVSIDPRPKTEPPSESMQTHERQVLRCGAARVAWKSASKTQASEAVPITNAAAASAFSLWTAALGENRRLKSPASRPSPIRIGPGSSMLTTPMHEETCFENVGNQSSIWRWQAPATGTRTGAPSISWIRSSVSTVEGYLASSTFCSTSYRPGPCASVLVQDADSTTPLRARRSNPCDAPTYAPSATTKANSPSTTQSFVPRGDHRCSITDREWRGRR